MADKLTVTINGREYQVDKTKEKELKKWLEDNAEIVSQTSEDLIIDIEATEGVQLEYNELNQEEKKEDEARPKESDERGT